MWDSAVEKIFKIEEYQLFFFDKCYIKRFQSNKIEIKQVPSQCIYMILSRWFQIPYDPAYHLFEINLKLGWQNKKELFKLCLESEVPPLESFHGITQNKINQIVKYLPFLSNCYDSSRALELFEIICGDNFSDIWEVLNNISDKPKSLDQPQAEFIQYIKTVCHLTDEQKLVLNQRRPKKLEKQKIDTQFTESKEASSSQATCTQATCSQATSKEDKESKDSNGSEILERKTCDQIVGQNFLKILRCDFTQHNILLADSEKYKSVADIPVQYQNYFNSKGFLGSQLRHNMEFFQDFLYFKMLEVLDEIREMGLEADIYESEIMISYTSETLERDKKILTEMNFSFTDTNVKKYIVGHTTHTVTTNYLDGKFCSMDIVPSSPHIQEVLRLIAGVPPHESDHISCMSIGHWGGGHVVKFIPKNTL